MNLGILILGLNCLSIPLGGEVVNWGFPVKHVQILPSRVKFLEVRCKGNAIGGSSRLWFSPVCVGSRYVLFDKYGGQSTCEVRRIQRKFRDGFEARGNR